MSEHRKINMRLVYALTWAFIALYTVAIIVIIAKFTMYWVGTSKVNRNPITKEKVLNVIDAPDIVVTTSDASADGGWVIFANDDIQYHLAGRYEVLDNSWEAEILYDDIYLEARRLYDQDDIVYRDCTSNIDGDMFEATTSEAYATCYRLDNRIFFITVSVDDGELPDEAKNRVNLILESLDYPTKTFITNYAISMNAN